MKEYIIVVHAERMEKALKQCVHAAKSWHGPDAFDILLSIKDALTETEVTP